MKQETQRRMTAIKAVLCFLICFNLLFPVLSIISVWIEDMPIWGGRVSFDSDLFGYRFLATHISNWLSAIWPHLSSGIIDNLAWSLTVNTVAVIVVAFTFVYSKWLIGSAMRLGSFRLEAVAWIIAAVLLGTIVADLFWVIRFNSTMSLNIFMSAKCGMNLVPDDSSPTIVIIYMVIAKVLISPIKEEVASRGLLAGIWMNSMGIWPAAILSSAVFAIAHMSFDLMLLYYFIVGLILFAARVRFGGIGVPILMHMAANASVTLPALYGC